ncbi:MAG: hypothetical protein WBW31_11725 [Candidatus Sulfotelmatobacter sp.]
MLAKTDSNSRQTGNREENLIVLSSGRKSLGQAGVNRPQRTKAPNLSILLPIRLVAP